MENEVKELMELGLSEAEAERVINRKAKAASKNETSKAVAEARLPKAQAELDHAAGRVEHWQGKAEAAQVKVDKYVAVISGGEGEADSE